MLPPYGATGVAKKCKRMGMVFDAERSEGFFGFGERCVAS
jgi:hypothetical protein